ncbi:hypothetical protein [Maridesulfovibrio sp.]|uniref:hypothetical protein n=1 Tax=Maridesulfovibrio sp. TaxID=2795000 RepID=UPI002A187910|nr:hypothetical protein [Maridesulfovibrio sp.]
MIMDTATIIIFAIRASIKIGEAGYKSYVDITRNRELVLPLPDLHNEMNEGDAWLFFFENESCEGAQFARKIEGSQTKPWPKVVALAKKLNIMTDDERTELVSLAIKAKIQLMAWKGEGNSQENGYDPGNGKAIAALYAVEGWENGTSKATSIQSVAGALIEVGIDFLQLNPKLFNINTTEGKLIKSFINELDEIEFATESLDKLPILLFTATLESVGANPEIFGNNTNVHVLIGNSAKKVATLVSERNEKINEDSSLSETEKRKQRYKMEAWGELIFRGVLDAAGHTAISDPGNYLGIQGEGSQLLARKVGEDVLDLMIGDDSIKFKPVFSQAGAERLTRTALDVVSKHPKLITQTDDKINGLLSEIAAGLAGTKMPMFDDAMVPEVARIILEKTGENLDLIWPKGQRSPQENVLFIATQATIKALSDSSSEYQYWRPDFTHSEMLMVIETVCDEIKGNPSWITGDNSNYNTALNLALTQTITCLKTHKAYISAETSAKIIAEVIKGIGLRQELLKITTTPVKQTTIDAAIDAIIFSIFKCDEEHIKWRICRDEVLQEIVQILISELAKSNASQDAVNALKDVINSFIADIKDGSEINFATLRTKANEKLQALT